MNEKLLKDIASLKMGDFIRITRNYPYPTEKKILCEVTDIEFCCKKGDPKSYKCCQVCPGRIKILDRYSECYGRTDEEKLFSIDVVIKKRTKLDEIFEEIDL